MNVVVTIVVCLFCFLVGCLVGNVYAEKTYQKMLSAQKKNDDETIHTLTDYIKDHTNTEEKTDEKIH